MISLRNRKQGFTLMELLLVMAVLALVATVFMPNFTEAYVTLHDGTAEQMVVGLVSNCKSMAIAGRVSESNISFNGKEIKLGDKTYYLPGNFTFKENKSFTFNLKGECTPAGGKVTIVRSGYSKDINVK